MDAIDGTRATESMGRVSAFAQHPVLRVHVFDTDELLTADPASEEEHDESQWRGFEASPTSLARRTGSA